MILIVIEIAKRMDNRHTQELGSNRRVFRRDLHELQQILLTLPRDA